MTKATKQRLVGWVLALLTIVVVAANAKAPQRLICFAAEARQ